MIQTLFITIIIEGAVAVGYALWRKTPVRPIFYTSLGINLVTQSFLWIVLNLFFQHYLSALLVSEILIWAIESTLLYAVLSDRLTFMQACLLSLSMNLASFAFGWFLPA